MTVSLVNTRRVEGEQCYDISSPFDVRHVGKLILESDYGLDVQAPRNHCVVQRPDDDDDLMLVRFTPFDSHLAYPETSKPYFLPNLADVTDSPNQAEKIHRLHLDKIGEEGIRPWFIDIRQQNQETNNQQIRGLAILQHLLPSGSEIAVKQPEIQKHITKVIDSYYDWIRRTKATLYLSDLRSSEQYSVLPNGDLVLHDVEPIYRSTAKNY